MGASVDDDIIKIRYSESRLSQSRGVQESIFLGSLRYALSRSSLDDEGVELWFSVSQNMLVFLMFNVLL